jgi:3-phenylpropionate/trans-cinnamate dioxygenase ferredoxin reductase component
VGVDTFVIVGGGLAATRAVEAIREGGHSGHVVLVCDDADLPYDHPPLSKVVLAGTEPPETAFLHPAEWYAEQDVDLRLGVTATRLDPAGHTLELADGTGIEWDRLLLATGSSVRRLDVPGADLDHVMYLRTMTQSTTLRDRLATGGAVVIIGAGWIGLEVAAAARSHGCDVTIVEPQPAPLAGVVGERVGSYFTDLHSSHGVTFRLGEGVQRLQGTDAVTGVVTSAGAELPAQTVVVGIGVTPNTGLAADAGLEVADGIVCDEALRTSAPDTYAAGDVANWLHPTLGQRIRVEHWANAQDGGYAAGRSMLGEDVRYDAIPFFFSDQYDAGLEYAGHVPRGTGTEVVLRGDPAEGEFMAFWTTDGRVLAGMHVNVWDTIDHVQALVRNKSVVDPKLLADPDTPLSDLVGEPSS